MNAVEMFDFQGQVMRTLVIDGDPWFVAADVCRVLEHTNPTVAVARLDDDERAKFNLGRQGQATIVNEPGLYALILGSRKAEAKAFKRWITHDVLPQIRRTGKYAGAQQIEYQIPQTYAAALELAALQAKEIEEKELAIAQAAPKVAAYDALMDAEGFYTMEAVAKLGGIGRTTLFNRLREAGVIQSGSRMPYQRYMGWFKITTSTWTDGEGVAHVSSTPRVRPEGLHRVLGKAGIELAAEAVA